MIGLNRRSVSFSAISFVCAQRYRECRPTNLFVHALISAVPVQLIKYVNLHRSRKTWISYWIATINFDKLLHINATIILYVTKLNKELIRRWDSERELSFRRQFTFANKTAQQLYTASIFRFIDRLHSFPRQSECFSDFSAPSLFSFSEFAIMSLPVRLSSVCLSSVVCL